MAAVPGLVGVAAPTETNRELYAGADDMRKMSVSEAHEGIRQRAWGFESRTQEGVCFEEYAYWAKIERDMERVENAQRKKGLLPKGNVPGTGRIKRTIMGLFRAQRYEDTPANNDLAMHGHSNVEHYDEKGALDNTGTVAPISPPSESNESLEAEWRRASRALRTSTWMGIFYLITTDILGWSQTPYVFANTGYNLAIGMFVLMGVAAGLSGLMIWRTFLKLDSSRYPVLTYGDPFFRLYGSGFRHFINVGQSLQMFLSVAVVQLGNTGILAQIAGTAGTDLCYIVCAIIVILVAAASGYMRSLATLGWFCNAAVWFNIISFIIIFAVAKKYGPDVTPAVENGLFPKSWATNPPPVKTFWSTPPLEYQQVETTVFGANFNGINSIVYAYSGALLFVAFLSEMRHPLDFWKAMLMAQTFITVVYTVFGAYIYAEYGQYSYSVINQTVKPFSLQIVTNVLSLLTGWLAIFLYFNIGLKTVYIEVGQALLRAPPITTKKGKYVWWSVGPIYWLVAFVICMSIPEFNAFTSFIGGLFSLNFTYSFSGMMFIGVKIQEAAALPGEGYDPVTGVTTRHDKGMKRWTRGFMKAWMWTIPTLLYILASLASSGMGTWAGVEGLIGAFAESAVTSWTCVNPYYVKGGE